MRAGPKPPPPAPPRNYLDGMKAFAQCMPVIATA